MNVQLSKTADQTYDVRIDGTLVGTVLKGWKATGGEGWLIGGQVIGNLAKVFPSRKAAVAALTKASSQTHRSGSPAPYDFTTTTQGDRMTIEYRVENFNGTGWDGIRMSQEGSWPVLDAEYSYNDPELAQADAQQIMEALGQDEDTVRVVKRVVPSWSVIDLDEPEHAAVDLLLSIQRQMIQYVLTTHRVNAPGDLDVAARLSLEAEFAAAYERQHGRSGQVHYRKMRDLLAAMIDGNATPPGLSPEQTKERNAAYAAFQEKLKDQVTV